MQFIDLHKQYDVIKEAVDAGIAKVLEEKRFIGGPEVSEFEDMLREYTGMKHVIGCASGTDALTIPLMAIGLEKTDAVFVPSFTFFASGESVTLAGGTPVFVDSDARTFNIDPVSLRERIECTLKEGKLQPKGIVAVDLFGLPADHEEIRKIADEYGLFVLEDAAQGFGGRIGEKKATSFGDIAGTSFFPAKPLGCYGDGGAIFTNDDELAEKMDSIHVHGHGADKYDNIRIGLNSRLDTFQATVLIEKLKIFDDELVKRNKIAARYTELLKDVVVTPIIPEGFYSSWAQYTIQVRSEEERKAVIDGMNAKGIPAMVYYPIPMHKSTAYIGDNEGLSLPVCERLSKTVMSLPMHPYLSEADQDFICETVKEVLKKYRNE